MATSSHYCARFLVGCDGANSRVREIIGSNLIDFGFQKRWLVLDLILKNSRSDLGDHSIQFCRPDRPMTYCRGPGSRRRWEITLLDSEDESRVKDLNYIWSLLEPWITPNEAELERSAVYTFRSQIAQGWRHGPIAIAGDAAHLTPPFLGQGMCMGIRDASNLGWKIGTIINQKIDSDILDSYESERSPHATAYIETAIKVGQIINSINQKVAVDGVLKQHMHSREMKSITPHLGESSLSVAKSKLTTDLNGRPAKQFRINPSGLLVDNFSGYRHVILSNRKPKGLTKDIFWVDSSSQIEAASFLLELRAKAAWIRPDRYLGAATKSISDLFDCLPNFLKH